MSEQLQSSQPGPEEFPNGPAVRGRYYGMMSQHDQRIVVMSEESWNDFGTTLESYRRTAKTQDSRIKELVAQIAMEQGKVADAVDRLNALRDVRRSEKRAELEPGGLVLPGSVGFSSTRKG